jgi:hypothetical protein
MTFTDESGKMLFDFTGFLAARDVDIPENKFDGASIVDFVAESGNGLFFIEVKNFVNFSQDPQIQASIETSQAVSYAELRNVNEYAKKMIKKLEHSLFIWVATAHSIKKPITYLLMFHLPNQVKIQERTRLIDRLYKYIPKGTVAAGVSFAMPTFAAVKSKYGFSVTMQPAVGVANQ